VAEGRRGHDRPLTVVVGAGISGLLLAGALHARGEAVVVLEKSRGFGGRLATRRVGDAVFDQGAQYFTARQSSMRELVAEWRARGAVTAWPGPRSDRFIGTPGMNAVGALLATGLDVRRGCKVLSATRTDGEWCLAIEHQPDMRAGRLVLTAPVPQSLALLASGGVPLSDERLHALQALTYHSCLALLLTLAGQSAIPAEGVVLDDPHVRWLADNTKKGISPGVPSAVTVHLQPAWSAEHYGDDEAQLARLVLPGIERWLAAPVVHVGLHRWKFSEPITTYHEPCMWYADLGLGFAGDAFGGPRVEGAAVSGLALAERMTQ